MSLEFFELVAVAANTIDGIEVVELEFELEAADECSL